MKQQHEYHLQVAICQYLRVQYPKVKFISTGASLRLTMPQANRLKKISCNEFSCPDLLILEPKRDFAGCCLELKIESPFKKDGTIKASQNNHLGNQWESLKLLHDKGFYADFIFTFEGAKEAIDYYMGLPDLELKF